MSKHVLIKLLPVLISIAVLLPLWTIHYLPFYDYQNHLLEAQVVVHYNDPASGYSEHYAIRPDWSLRSNALTTLLFIFFGSFLSIEIAGKLVVTGYVILLITGLLLLLKQLQRPLWLLLAAAPLINNLTLTGGMMNAAYALALTPWMLLCYLRWQDDRGWLYPGLLALLSLAQYTAHGFGWALTVLVLSTLAASDRLHWQQAILLALALSMPTPMQLLTRPVMSVIPILLLAGCFMLAAIIRLLKLQQRQLIVLGLMLAGTLLLLIKLFKQSIVERIPGIDFSLNAKFLSLPRLLALPFQSFPFSEGQVYANLAILLLAVIAWSALCWRLERRWLPAIGLLSFALLVTPYRTVDLIVIEPRILLVMLLLMLVASDIRGQGSGVRRQGSGLLEGQQALRAKVAILSLTGLALLHVTSAGWVAMRYDATARAWATRLAQIGPGQRVLVLSNPLALPDSPVNRLARLAQVFDGNQFSATYALEHGGFISNTFYNGPLLPRQPDSVPDYWASDFNPSSYLQSHCAKVRQDYAMILAWNAHNTALERALQECTGAADSSGDKLTLWSLPSY